MQRLVDDLLTLSALESEQNPLRDEPFAVVPLLLALSADAKALSSGAHEIALDIGEAATIRSAAATSSRAHSAISSATRFAIRRIGGTITLAWRVDADGAAHSRHRHAASASRRSTCRG